MREGALFPTFTERDNIHLVGLTMPLDAGATPEIPELWNEFRPLEASIDGRIEGTYYGVVELSDRTDGSFDYTVAVEVAAPVTPPEGMVVKTLAGGRFAVFTHVCAGGPIGPGVQQTMRMIHGEWVRMTRTPLRDFYDLEVYGQRFDPATLTGEIEIWVPVE
jgi:AraC family transcriptional regulator